MTKIKREGAIRQQLKQVMFRHRKNFIDEHLRPAPQNCAHNGHVRGPQGPFPILHVCRKEVDGTWHNVVCDAKFGGEAQAGACPYFCPKKDAEDLKSQFKEDFEKAIRSDLPLGLLAQRYPDMVALLWVLGRDVGVLLELEEDTADTPKEEDP